MKKKTLLSLFVLSLFIFAFCVIGANAETIASGECGENLTWTLDSEGTLTISGTGKMTGWSSSPAPWYTNKIEIKSVVIEDGVTSIGSFAFIECTNLTSITIPDSVATIGSYAFIGCTNLTSITIPDSVATIGGFVFSECASLTDINVSENNENYTSVDGVLFDKAKTSLIKYPSAKTETEYIIPDSVTNITNFAFEDCNSLTSITIPYGVKSINYATFSGCINLTSITIPGSVTSIDNSAFSNCDALTDVYFIGTEVDWNNIIISSNNDTLTNATRHYVVATIASGECGENLTWTLDSEGLLTISGTGEMTNWSSSSSAPWYKYKSSIKTVVIESGATSIGRFSFFGCTSLTSITIPNSVISIGAYAFRDCTSVTSITIPDSVTSIGNNAFRNCTGLTEITIPYGVTGITTSLFYGCSNLTTVTIPNSIINISSNAFYNCTALTDVYYIGTEEGWNNITISSGNEPLTNATRHYVVATIASGECGENLTWTLDSAGLLTISGTGEMTNWISSFFAPWYKYKSSIKSIVIENGVTSIGNRAFYSCTRLTSVTIPDSVTSIDISAFYNCTNLKDINVSINNENYIVLEGVLFNKDKTTLIQYPPLKTDESYTIPDTVETIGDYAFLNCINLKSINVTGNNSSFASVDGVLFNKDTTTLIRYPEGKTDISYTVPDSVTEISASAFDECKVLTNIIISNNVKTIGNVAFNYCYGLTNITIPDSVTMIGKAAFQACKGLRTITLPAGITSISEGTFNICSGLTTITIPDSVTSVGYMAFNSCKSLTDIYYKGAEEDWNNITIGEDNESLTNATRHYVEHTKTTVSEDGNTFTVVPKNIESGKTVILGLYNGNILSEIQTAIYSGNELTFNATTPYTEAKVMVWNDLGSLVPICDFEKVK